MRYTFYYDGPSGGEVRVGFYYEDGIVPMADVTDPPRPEDMLSLEADALERLNALYCAIAKGEVPAEKKSFPLAPLLLSPDANVFCVGRNYRSVAQDMNRATSKDIQVLERPAFFYKPNRAVTPSGSSIVACGDDTQNLDYEGEIGVIIGKQGKDIPLEEAESYIYGYTVCNDVSARDVMKAYYQMYKGKSMDTFAPIGPCIVTKEDIPDFRSMELETYINHQLRQKGNTSELLFDFPTIIYYLSKAMTLMPGDIIMTGTPAGIGAAMDPPHFLQENDLVEVSVKGVGILKNNVHIYSRQK